MTKSETWTRERLQRYLDDQIQEDLNLDYKGAAALARDDKKKLEVHKDVSAMANSAGGVLIYGIREYDDKERKHLPERFDPVDQTVFTREWIEQVIGGIQPRVQNVVITPVSIGPGDNDVAFVVEVPVSNTAHQASDKRYYKRFNFSSVAMHDYEVRDVMNRSAHALIDLEFKLELGIREAYYSPAEVTPPGSVRPREEPFAYLNVFARNNGAVYAQYVVAYVYMPIKLAGEDYDEKAEDGRAKIRIDNVKNDYVSGRPVYARNVPILPGTREELDLTSLYFDYASNEKSVAEIEWEVYADNAQVRRGTVQFSDLRADANIRYEV